MGWDDLIDLGLDLAGGLLDHHDTQTYGFDALVVSGREDQSKSVRRGRYLLHLVRFTGETGWYRCEERDFSRMEPGTCAHFEVKEPDFITSCTRWTRTPEQISQMLIEDKGD